MIRSSQRVRDTPNHDLDERASTKHMPFIDQQFGLHAG